MAIWQVDLQMIPMSDGVAGDFHNSEELPLPISLVLQAQQRLSEYFGSPWLMLSDWLVYGPENGSRVDFVFISPHTASITVRFDMRSDAQQFLVLICRLAWHLGCRFYSADLKRTVEASEATVVEALVDAHNEAVLSNLN